MIGDAGLPGGVLQDGPVERLPGLVHDVPDLGVEGGDHVLPPVLTEAFHQDEGAVRRLQAGAFDRVGDVAAVDDEEAE